MFRLLLIPHKRFPLYFEQCKCRYLLMLISVVHSDRTNSPYQVPFKLLCSPFHINFHTHAPLCSPRNPTTHPPSANCPSTQKKNILINISFDWHVQFFASYRFSFFFFFFKNVFCPLERTQTHAHINSEYITHMLRTSLSCLIRKEKYLITVKNSYKFCTQLSIEI